MECFRISRGKWDELHAEIDRLRALEQNARESAQSLKRIDAENQSAAFERQQRDGAEIDRLTRAGQDLSMMIRRMARRVSLIDAGDLPPGSGAEMARQATDLLARHGLGGSPLRESEVGQ